MDVHAISVVCNVYGSDMDYAGTHQGFLDPNVVSAGTTSVEGYQVHRLDAKTVFGSVLCAQLAAKCRAAS